MAGKEFVIGIDLGTTISKAAYVDQDGNPRMIPNAEGSILTPSIVGITESGERVVGELAKRQLILHPERTVRDIKRLMGTNQKVKLGDREYTPQEISAMILQKIKRDAEAFLGGVVKKAVISVPAHFDDNQRTATKEAGEIAGLEVIRVFAEPTAAALAYGLDKLEEARILVFDLGGGTLDVSLLEVGEGVFEVKCVSGDTYLGGRDWDAKIVNWLIQEFKKETGIDLSKDRAALQRLHDAAEKAKHELSSLTQTTISLPFIAADATGPKHLERTITRAQFEAMCTDLLDRCRKCIDQVLADAKLSKDQIDKVVLIGGSTRMPMIRNLVRDYFGREPLTDINPDEAVARGAAIQAAILTGQIKKEILLVDVTPLTLGVEVLGGLLEPLIPKNTKIPCRKTKVFTTAHDYQTNVEIRVYQGERPMAADNRFLGSFILDGIPPAPRGIPQIEVTFDLDANGILQVTAKDLGTGRTGSITIHRPGALPREEIERMIKEAKEYEEQDRKRRELAETKNNAEALIYNLERALKEVGDKLDKSKLERVRKSLEQLREILAKVRSPDQISELKQAMDKLNQEAGEVFAELYRRREYKPPEEGKPPEGKS